MKYVFLIVILFTINLGKMCFAVIDKYEKAAIEEMMERVGLKMDDVNFAKNWSPSAFTIPIMLGCLETPWVFPEFVNELKEEILKKEFVDFYTFITDIVYLNFLDEASEFELDSAYLYDLESKLSKMKRPLDIMKYAEMVYERSDIFLKQSFQALSPDEINYLRRFLYSNAVGGSEDAESYAFINQIISLPETENYLQFHIDLINKVDFASLVMSGRYFFAGMEKLYKQDFSSFSFKRPVKYKSIYGNMIVGTTGNDVYSSSEGYVFIFDPAGDDTFTFNMSTDIDRPFLSIIDLSGNDTYRNDHFGELFNALFGNIFHYDGGGNDYYFGGDLAFSGNLGSIISIDKQGWDTYIAGSRSLGAGHLGVGILINIGGNDYYYGTMFTQGIGGTLGFGALMDFKDGIWNNDCYNSGGKWTDSLRDQNDYYAMSQGFGFGLRPSIAGGIGMLFDESGNDKYNGGVFSQGVSYWYAMGILLDLEGNDFYNSCWYPQGSGIHFSVGFLYDESGDDSYFSKRGPGQGAGHDYGVGFFVDRSGNDYYSVDGGNGMGRANSVGVFVDSRGNDRYERKGYSNYGSSHHNFEDRGSGNIGIFLDAGGHDTYADPKCGNNSYWIDGVFGIGADKELERLSDFETPSTETSTTKSEVTEDVFFEQMAIEDLFMTAVYGASPNNARAKELLLSREEEFVDYFMSQLLHSNDIMIQITAAEMIPKFNLLHDRLIEGLTRENPVAVGNAIYYIGLTGNLLYVDILEEMLSKEDNVRYTNALLLSLSRLKSEKSLDIIARYIDDESPYRRTIVARALKNLNTKESIELLFTMKEDADFIIRAMIIMMEE